MQVIAQYMNRGTAKSDAQARATPVLTSRRKQTRGMLGNVTKQDISDATYKCLRNDESLTLTLTIMTTDQNKIYTHTESKLAAIKRLARHFTDIRVTNSSLERALADEDQLRRSLNLDLAELYILDLQELFRRRHGNHSSLGCLPGYSHSCGSVP